MAIDSIERNANAPSRRTPVLKDEVSAYYLTLLARLSWPSRPDGTQALRTVGLTSCYRREGVSTVAGQLAASAAATSDKRILLVDANLRRPTAERTFGVNLRPGLSDLLADGSQASAAIQASRVEGLWVLAAGQFDAGGVPDAVAFGRVMAEVRAEFDLVVVDLPAADNSEALTPLAAMLDGVLLVVEAERVRREVANRTIELLRRADVRLLGAVLNKRRQHVPNWLYRTL